MEELARIDGDELLERRRDKSLRPERRGSPCRRGTRTSRSATSQESRSNRGRGRRSDCVYYSSDSEYLGDPSTSFKIPGGHFWLGLGQPANFAASLLDAYCKVSRLFPLTFTYLCRSKENTAIRRLLASKEKHYRKNEMLGSENSVLEPARKPFFLDQRSPQKSNTATFSPQT